MSFDGNSFDGSADASGLISTTFTDSSNGYAISLTGWTHIRSYAKGYLRNIDGTAQATVSGLTPGVTYFYKVFQYNVGHGGAYQGQNGLSVNGQDLSPTTTGASLDPTAQGRDAAVQSNPIYKNPVRHIPKTGTIRYIMQKEPVQSGT